MLDPVTCIGCSSCVMIGQSIIGYDVLHNFGKNSLSNEEDINLLTNELQRLTKTYSFLFIFIDHIFAYQLVELYSTQSKILKPADVKRNNDAKELKSVFVGSNK